jgi:uncharacterized phage protein (TIGR02218 family)
MRDMSNNLVAFLNTTSQLMAVDLYTFDLKNGVTMRYCNATDAVTFNGSTWLAAPAGLTRSKIRWATGVEVDSLDIDFQADASILVAGMPMLAAAVSGLFDNCRVTLQRLFMKDWLTPVDTLLLFQGNTAPAEILRMAIHLTVKSDLERLNVMIPPNVYQATCLHSLYSPGCTVKAATYRATGTATSVNANGGIVAAWTQPDGYYQMGAIKFTSGANTGLTRTVKSHTGGAVYPTKAFPYPIANGDAFVITPGCDKLQNGDCKNKFNNVINFKGFPFIPVPETAA